MLVAPEHKPGGYQSAAGLAAAERFASDVDAVSDVGSWPASPRNPFSLSSCHIATTRDFSSDVKRS